MAKRLEITEVPVYEVMKYAPNGVCDQVLLVESHGKLLAVVPPRGRGRYSLPNAFRRTLYFQEQKSHR